MWARVGELTPAMQRAFQKVSYQQCRRMVELLNTVRSAMSWKGEIVHPSLELCHSFPPKMKAVQTRLSRLGYYRDW